MQAERRKGIDEHDADTRAVAEAAIWLIEFIAAPIALVLPGAVLRCNGALERMLESENDSGRRRVREALKTLANAMRTAWRAHGPPVFDERASCVRTASRRYTLEPIPSPTGLSLGLIHVRSRVAADPASIAKRFGFTPREAQVASLITRGLSNKSIASELGLSPHTVRRHTESVFRKTGVASRAALSARLHA